jgi:putative serine protease PepD
MSENQANPGSEGYHNPPPATHDPQPDDQPGAPPAPQPTAPASSSYQAPSGYSANPWSQPGPYTATNPTVPITGPVPAEPLSAPTYPAPARSGGAGKVAVAVIAAGVIALGAGGVGGFVGYALHGDNSPLQSSSNSAPHNAAPIIDRGSLASVAAGVQPVVVSVKNNGGEGSGVVISTDGYIITNNHVVAAGRGADVDTVTFNSGKQIQAKVVGTDPKTDIAVLKADATGLTAVSWGNSDDVQVGDTVLAIGSPLGLQGSVTAGIISALHRTITVGDEQSPFSQGSGSTTIGDAIQTDAPINPGNSGGALVDTSGKLVGINSAIATSGSNGNIGVGFAIPANKAKIVADQLIKGGKVSHPFLGVSIGDAQNGGAQIQSVQSGSPAAKAGLQEGDVVTKVNDRSITSSGDLVGAIQSSSVGSQLQLTVVRNGSERTVTVTVGEQ